MILRSLLAAFLLLILLVAVLAAGVLGSQAGSAFIVRWLEQQLEPRLAVTALEGSLLTSLCAERVSYEQPGVRVRVEDVCVAPNLWSSIDFLHVSLQSLEAGSVLVETTAVEDAPADAGPLLLPLAIGVESLRVGTLSVNGVRIDDLDGAVDLRNSDLAIASSFSYAGTRVALRTRGPWDALRAEASALGVRAEAVANVQADGLPFRLSAEAAAFDLAPYIGRQVSLADVRLSGSGSLQGYRFDVEGGVSDPAANGHVRGSGRGDWTGMNITALRLADVTLVDVPLSVEELTGRARLDWAERFSLAADGVQARGVLTQRPLRAEVPALKISGEGVDFERATLQVFEGAMAGTLRVDGHVGGEGTVDLRVQAEQLPLGVLDPELAGLGKVRLAVTGDALRPSLSGSVDLADLRWRGQVVERLSAGIDGFPDNARLTVSARHTDADVEGRLAYLRDPEGTVLLELRMLEVRLTKLPAAARLLEPSTVTVRGSAVSVPETCVQLFPTGEQMETRLEAARLCFAADYPHGGLTLGLEPWTLPELPLPAGGVTLRGSATASASLSAFDPLTGQASIQLVDLVADHEGGDRLVLGRVDAAVTAQDGALRAELRTPPGAEQELLLDGSVSAALTTPVGDSVLSGALELSLDGIWAARSLLPMDVTYELEDMQGVMGVRADVGGTVSAPLVNGVLSLNDVGALVLALNARFSNFGAEARLVDSRTIAFESRGAVGSGALAVNGELVGLDTPAPRLATRFRLDRAEVVNLPDYTAVVSGEVNLGMGSDDLALTGDLTLNQADITIADLPDTAVSPSADEVLVGSDAATPTQQIRTTNVNLTLGKDVRLEAFGLTGRLTGSLRLEEAPRRLQSVTGTIALRDAEFEAYGQVLTVERGRLTFTGPVDNPTVDVQASKVVTYEERDYKISLLISGTAKELVTTIVSQPALAQDDALALLLTGRTISQISTQERSNVSGAALSMGLLNAIGVTQNIATRLNLEEIIVEQDDAGNKEFGAAVRLNRDVYLRYTYGVFSRLGGVLLRYRLSNRVSVQA
ncbi:MAG: translocation/assembly module TamB domain-containing protein, partial [Pseudomonadales bacterium]